MSYWGSELTAGNHGSTGWPGFWITQDQTHLKSSGSLQKRKRLLLPVPPSSTTFLSKKQKGGIVLFPAPRYLALSEEQRQQYISTLLEKKQKVYTKLCILQKTTSPKHKEIQHCKLYAFSFSIYIHVCTYTYIYACVGARLCIYSVLTFFCMVCGHYFTKLTFSRKKPEGSLLPLFSHINNCEQSLCR